VKDDQEKEIWRRIKMTLLKFGKLNKYLQNPKFPQAFKMLMQTVMPTFLVNSWQWRKYFKQFFPG